MAVIVTEVCAQIELSASEEVKETDAVLLALTVTVAVPVKLLAAAVQFASLKEDKVYDFVLVGDTEIV